MHFACCVAILRAFGYFKVRLCIDLVKYVLQAKGMEMNYYF